MASLSTYPTRVESRIIMVIIYYIGEEGLDIRDLGIRKLRIYLYAPIQHESIF